MWIVDCINVWAFVRTSDEVKVEAAVLVDFETPVVTVVKANADWYDSKHSYSSYFVRRATGESVYSAAKQTNLMKKLLINSVNCEWVMT